MLVAPLRFELLRRGVLVLGRPAAVAGPRLAAVAGFFDEPMVRGTLLIQRQIGSHSHPLSGQISGGCSMAS